MILVSACLPDPVSVLDAGAFGAGALIRIESAATIAGVYAEITTLPIVATQVQYQYWDPAGTATTWYRWRVSDAGNAIDSDYSAPLKGTNPAGAVFPTSYASLDRLLTLFETVPTQPRKLSRLGDLLGTATSQVIEACRGIDYFNHPGTWIIDGNGTDVIHDHLGIVSLSLLELSEDGGQTWRAVASTDYVLRGTPAYHQRPIPVGEPFFHVVFTGYGSARSVPSGMAAARLTGVRGWPAIPEVLIESSAQRARQLAFASGDYSGSVGAPDTGWGAMGTDRFWPQSLYNFLARERDRFASCFISTVSVRR